MDYDDNESEQGKLTKQAKDVCARACARARVCVCVCVCVTSQAPVLQRCNLFNRLFLSGIILAKVLLQSGERRGLTIQAESSVNLVSSPAWHSQASVRSIMLLSRMNMH